MNKSIDLVTDALRKDPNVIAACEAIDKELEEIYKEIPEILFWPFVEQQVPPLLDVLAWEMHVDVWQSFGKETLDVPTKIQLINESIAWHQKKGTKWAVVQMLNVVFKQGKVTEWFEYGGRPYFFRIITEDDIIEREDLLAVLAAVYAVKNVRSWLDAFIRARLYGQTLYIGFATTHYTTTTIRMAKK
jgi:phage tail P2-like protein